MSDIIDKTCIVCDIPQSIGKYYTDIRMMDGHLGKCKICCKKQATARRNSKIDEVRAYDRARGNRQPPGYLEAYRSNNPEKYLAHNAVNNAVRDGRLNKPKVCERCPSTARLHGHHEDYSKPLEVEWLCPVCHKNLITL